MLDRRRAFLFVVAFLTLSSASAKPTEVDSTKVESPSVSENGGTEPIHTQVLVIGAGPSGVATASRLMENGVLNVTILEAENRIGGRTYTVPFAGHVIDMGAQWVHGAVGNVVYELANPLGLLLDDGNPTIRNMRYVQANGQLPDQKLMTHLFNLTDYLKDDENVANYNGTYKDFLKEKFSAYVTNPANNITADPELLENFFQWITKMLQFSEGASLDKVSARGHESYRECAGNQVISWINNGYSNIIDLLTKRYPNPEQELPVRQKTKLNTEVKTIHWGPKGVVGPTGKQAVLVETENGERYTADILVVTVSLGVLKEKAETLFDPPLPEIKKNAIQYLGFGQVDKIFLEFPEVWWPTDVTSYNIIASDEDRVRFNQLHPEYSDKGEWLNGITGLYTVAHQPKVLFDWIVDEPARNMEKYTDDEVKTAMVKWTEMFLNKTLPEPVGFARSKWYSNPHFRGSYSHNSVDAHLHNAQPDHLAQPLLGPSGSPVVLFAGEGTNQHRYSTVDGAVETGWREADRILDLLGVENRSRKPAPSS